MKSTTLYLNRQSVQFQHNDYYYKQRGVKPLFMIARPLSSATFR